jgi:hypothetical protein
MMADDPQLTGAERTTADPPRRTDRANGLARPRNIIHGTLTA